MIGLIGLAVMGQVCEWCQVYMQQSIRMCDLTRSITIYWSNPCVLCRTWP